jgi:PsbP-like protein
MSRMINFVIVITLVIIAALAGLVVITQRHQWYTYAQIPGIIGSDSSNNRINRSSENTTTTETTTPNNATTTGTSGNFSTYKNDQYGYTIQYPSDWQITETTIPSDVEKNTGVLLPNANIASASQVAALWIMVKNTTAKTQLLDTNNATNVNGKSPRDYVTDEIDKFATHPQLYSSIRYVKDKPVMLVNNTISAWELDYTNSGLEGGGAAAGQEEKTYNIHYFLVKDNRVYGLLFSSGYLKVQTFLPIVHKMIDSFQITK